MKGETKLSVKRVFISQPAFYMGRRQSKMHAIDIATIPGETPINTRIRLTAVYKDAATDEYKQGHGYLEFQQNDFHDLMFSIMPYSQHFNRDINGFVEIRLTCKWYERNLKKYLKSLQFFHRNTPAGKMYMKLVPYKDAENIILYIIGYSVEMKKEMSLIYTNYLRFDDKLFKQEIAKNASKS